MIKKVLSTRQVLLSYISLSGHLCSDQTSFQHLNIAIVLLDTQLDIELTAWYEIK